MRPQISRTVAIDPPRMKENPVFLIFRSNLVRPTLAVAPAFLIIGTGSGKSRAARLCRSIWASQPLTFNSVRSGWGADPDGRGS
jgi:hypothetical protein